MSVQEDNVIILVGTRTTDKSKLGWHGDRETGFYYYTDTDNEIRILLNHENGVWLTIPPGVCHACDNDKKSTAVCPIHDPTTELKDNVLWKLHEQWK